MTVSGTTKSSLTPVLKALAAKPIEPPKDDGDVARFLSEVDTHPDTTEVVHRWSGLEAEIRDRTGEDDIPITRYSRLVHSARQDISEKRRREHEKIVKRLLQDDARTPKGQRPLAVVTLGLPAAGKTTVAVPLVWKRFGLKFTTINPDDAKELLSDYRGWNAAPLHEESAYIAESVVEYHAISGRHNVIYDITGRNCEKIALTIERCVEVGYDVRLLLVDVKPFEAAYRAWSRFQKNPFGTKRGTAGRYVPPSYVYHNVGHKPRETFDRLKSAVGAYCRIEYETGTSSPIISEQKDW